MVDQAWDNGGTGAPPRRGMPLWGKILLGCGGGCCLGSVLLLATCVGGAHWVAKNGLPQALDRAVGSAFLDKAWSELFEAAEALSTDERTLAYYRSHPGLDQNYPTEAEFLMAVKDWRPRLGTLPQQRPPMKELLGGMGGEFSIRTIGDEQKLSYRMPKGGVLELTLQGEKIVDVDVQ